MKKYIILVFAVLSLFVITGSTAFHHSWSGLTGSLIDRFSLEAAAGRIAWQLDLDDDQKQDLHQIMTEVADEVNKLRLERNSRCREVAGLMRQDVVDRDLMDQMIARKFAGMQAVADLAAERLADFHESLTPEQRDKAAKKIESAGERRGLAELLLP